MKKATRDGLSSIHIALNPTPERCVCELWQDLALVLLPWDLPGDCLSHSCRRKHQLYADPVL